MTTRIGILLAAAVLVGAVALVALSNRTADDRDRVPAPAAAAGLPAAKPLPAPSGDVVLRVKGVERGNVRAHTTTVDFATLEQLSRTRATIREPFVKRDVTFEGITMRELLARAGVAGSARSLFLHALDDYTVKLPISGLIADGLLATRADGKPIPIADGGPIRIVFTGDGPLAAVTDNWIWSLDSIRVVP